MPFRVICGKCATILYEGLEVKAPYEILQGYDGRCPSCAKRLSTSPTRIQISPIKTVKHTAKP